MMLDNQKRYTNNLEMWNDSCEVKALISIIEFK